MSNSTRKRAKCALLGVAVSESRDTTGPTRYGRHRAYPRRRVRFIFARVVHVSTRVSEFVVVVVEFVVIRNVKSILTRRRLRPSSRTSASTSSLVMTYSDPRSDVNAVNFSTSFVRRFATALATCSC